MDTTAHGAGGRGGRLAVQSAIVSGRQAGLVEKRHLVLKRLMQELHEESGRPFTDLGTDYAYDFYEDYRPTIEAREALVGSVSSMRNYPSSYGTPALRDATRSFFRSRFGVALSDDEVMVSAGASQVFDALTRALSGSHIVVPYLTLSTVTSIGIGNGAAVARYASTHDFGIDLDSLDSVLRDVGPRNVKFVYVNSPANPTGRIQSRSELEALVALAREHGVLVVHDHDSWCTTHNHEPSTSILEVAGASEVALSIVSVSKEFGLPGLRIGAVAGAREAINVLRMHNSEFCVMLPEFAQSATAAALLGYAADSSRDDLQKDITRALETAIDMLLSMGWPDDAILWPQGGYKFIFQSPPEFRGVSSGVSGAELFDFHIVRSCGVKLSTVRSFNPDVTDWMRLVIMRRAADIHAALARMDTYGIRWEMTRPAALEQDYKRLLDARDLWNI